MQYISPIPLLLYKKANFSNITEAYLSKVQKELLVELELEGGLSVDGQPLSKDDVISVIEGLREPNVLLFHRWIYQSSHLHNVLRNRETSQYDQLFDPSLTYHEAFSEFKRFISPYLAQPLGKVLHQAVLKRDFPKARELSTLVCMIDVAHVDQAFGKLKTALEDIDSEIEAISKNTTTFFPSRFAYATVDFIDFLNALRIRASSKPAARRSGKAFIVTTGLLV